MAAAAAANVRIRVAFDEGGILSKSQKKAGLKRSWVLLRPHLRTVSDVVSYLFQSFHLYRSCRNGIILSMDGFVLPPFESTAIFKDNDLICVKKKKTRLRDVEKAIRGVENLIEDEIIEKQPISSDIKLLANEEYNKETGGYQSETDDGEDVGAENVFHVDDAPQRDAVSKKRKAPSRVESSKTKSKRQKHLTPESDQKKHLHQCEQTGTTEKRRKHEDESKEAASAHTQVCVNGTNRLELTSGSKEPAEPEEKWRKPTPSSDDPSGDKKVSRSTRRKRLKRHWLKEQRAKATSENHQCEGQSVKHGEDPKTNAECKMGVNTNIIDQQQADDDSDADDDLVPVMIRPGYIRFTPSAKAKDVQDSPEANGRDVHPTENGDWEGHSAKKKPWGARNNQVEKETFLWNGVTSKRKGQKWGMEKQSTSSWKEPSDYVSSFRRHDTPSSQEGILQKSIHCNGITDKWNGQKWGDEKQSFSSEMGLRDDDAYSSAKHLPSDGGMDFEKLVPLTDLPKAGDIIAYRLVELSSSWCPELSSFRVGKISWFLPESNKIMLVPDPGYPLNFEKKMNDDDDDNTGEPPDFSVYNEDGSLEIDFPSLVDVRVVKFAHQNQSEFTETPLANDNIRPSGTSDQIYETQNGSKDVKLATCDGELSASASVNGKKDVWEEISETLSAKKAELMQENGWNKKENRGKGSWLRNRSALGPIMERLRAQSAI